MHETSQDVRDLQTLMDRSHAAAGAHLREVITADRLLPAADVVALLDGMCLLVLATVSSRGRPVAGPVDGIFFRGHWYFGSSSDSVRFTHIRRSPYVSASHLPGEHLQVTVHGTAAPIDVADPEHAAFRQALLDVYTPRYGDSWERFLDSGPVYARIDAEKFFVFWMPEPTTDS